MWLFDKILTARIRDLEHTNEILIGANQVLTNELAEAKQREAVLLNKVFDFAGLNKIEHKVEHNNKPVSIGTHRIPWSKLKDNLELQSREKYWTNKSKEKDSEQSSGKAVEDELDKLEKETIGD